MTPRSTAAMTLALLTAVLCSACVIAPTRGPDAIDIQKMSEQAVATCGAGNVKDVNSKSFSCK